jgi:hypothetical protein
VHLLEQFRLPAVIPFSRLESELREGPVLCVIALGAEVVIRLDRHMDGRGR